MFKRVLIIEDNQDLADSLGLLLKLLGHETRVAYSGPDGLRLACEWRPDVVVSDIGMPGMDGYEVASRLRQNPDTASMRLIAVTAYGSDEDRRRALSHGFNHHVTKPADPDVLFRLLSDA